MVEKSIKWHKIFKMKKNGNSETNFMKYAKNTNFEQKKVKRLGIC